MKLLFYSKYCKNCTKLFSLKEGDKEFDSIKKISVDDSNKLPQEITKVPTLVSTDLLGPISGKAVFSYFNCLEMFYLKTNNIDYWKDKDIKRPVVDKFKANDEEKNKKLQIVTD